MVAVSDPGTKWRPTSERGVAPGRSASAVAKETAASRLQQKGGSPSALAQRLCEWQPGTLALRAQVSTSRWPRGGVTGEESGEPWHGFDVRGDGQLS